MRLLRGEIVMNRNILYIPMALILILALSVGSSAAYAAQGNSVKVIVGFAAAPGAEGRQLIESLGGRVIFQYHLIPAIAAVIPSRAIAQLQSDPTVSYVEEEQHRIPEEHIVDGELYDGSYEILPWGVDRVKADDLWDADSNLQVDPGAVAGQGVRVAVLDTGLDTTHPDLAANVDFGASYDFLGNDSDVSDIPGPVTGHGTATSGIVAAIDNTIGVIGVAPHATVLMYRVCDSALNDCPDSAIIAGLEASVDNGADVVSMSFGGIGFSIAMKEAIQAASDAGLVLVASAGNTPSKVAGARHYPSGFAEVIAVGATDINDNLADFSTFGGHQELVAPGVDTPTTTIQGLGRDNLLTRNTAPSGVIQSNPMTFSGTGTVTSNLVYAGLGRMADFAAVDCSATSGHQIALIERGVITFGEKVDNAVAAGCIGAVIYNRPDLTGNFFGTLGAPKPIPAVSISTEDGLALRDGLAVGADVGVNVTLEVISLDYDTFSGTSASAPYVSGVAALVLSANPNLSDKEVRNILDGTAVDLGEAGRDNVFGWGLVDAYAAVQCATGVITCELP
jgi:serine protease